MFYFIKEIPKYRKLYRQDIKVSLCKLYIARADTEQMLLQNDNTYKSESEHCSIYDENEK